MNRRIAGFVLFVGAFLAVGFATVVPQPDTLRADPKQEAALKKEVGSLQAELKKAHDQLGAMQQQIAQRDAAFAQLKAANAAAGAPKQLEALKKQVASLQAMKNAPYAHTVVLKLKKDAPAAELVSLLTDVPVLNKIASVRGLWFGVPAAIGTPDAATDYNVAITVLFDNADGLASYFADDIHKVFALKHLKYWETPVVYDYYLKVSP